MNLIVMSLVTALAPLIPAATLPRSLEGPVYREIVQSGPDPSHGQLPPPSPSSEHSLVFPFEAVIPNNSPQGGGWCRHFRGYGHGRSKYRKGPGRGTRSRALLRPHYTMRGHKGIVALVRG